MWKHTPTGQYVSENSAWADESGTQHPNNWGQCWGAEEKAAHGLVFRQDDPTPDARLFNYVRNEDGSVTATPKPLNAVKSEQVAEINLMQRDFLSHTDWAYIRLADIGVAVPAEIKSYRDAVRAAAAAMIAAIDGATTVEEMATVLASEVMQWPTGDDK